MSKDGGTFFTSVIHRRMLSRWANAAKQAQDADLQDLRRQSARARQLRQHLDQVIRVADMRLAAPQSMAGQIPQPKNADWAWRPDVWRNPVPEHSVIKVQSPEHIGEDVKLFHDCTLSEIVLRQKRNRQPEDLAPSGLSLEVFAFSGSFLSLVMDLPEAAVTGLQREHVLALDTVLEVETPLDIFARLNIRHGPNTEQIVRKLPIHTNATSVEFDLAYAAFNDRKVTKAWIDLIFETPQMNHFILRDLTFNRHPRARL